MRKKKEGMLAIWILVLTLVLSITGSTVGAQTKKSGFTIGLLSPTQAHPSWVQLTTLAEQACKTLGDESILVDGRDREDVQIQAFESFIARGVDGIVAAPFSGAVGIKMVEMAERAGIPVVYVDRAPEVVPEDFQTYISFVGHDDEASGYMVGQYLAEQGVKKVGWLEGAPGSICQRWRTAGFVRAVAEHDMELVSKLCGWWMVDKGMRAAEDMLSAHPDIEAIGAANDGMALGALAAVRRIGKEGEILIASIDFCPSEIAEEIKKGNIQFTLGGHCWTMMAIGVNVLHDYLSGLEPLTTWINVPMVPVTIESVDYVLSKAYAPDGGIKMDIDWTAFSRIYNPKANYYAKITDLPVKK